MDLSSTDIIPQHEHSVVPRQVWRSNSGHYRLIVVDHGPAVAIHQLPELPDEHYCLLEVREANDSLGNERWRTVDLYGDQRAWRDAFFEFASDKGLFGVDVSERVRALLRGVEER